MLVLTTLQNICQLLIHVWRQPNPATRNQTRDHLISAKLYNQMPYQLRYNRLDMNYRTCCLMRKSIGIYHAQKPVTLLCVSSLRGHGNLEKKAVTLLCVSSLRGHGNLARRIKLTRVTKENLRLKDLEVKGGILC